MSVSGRLRFTLIVGIAAIAVSGGRAYTQADVDPAKNTLPNPNPTSSGRPLRKIHEISSDCPSIE